MYFSVKVFSLLSKWRKLAFGLSVLFVNMLIAEGSAVSSGITLQFSFSFHLSYTPSIYLTPLPFILHPVSA